MTKPFEPEVYQLGWIFEHGQEYFAQQIEKMEIEIARHQAFPNAPIYGTSLTEKSREERLARCLHWLETYKPLHQYCQRMRLLCAERSSEEGAAAAVASIVARITPTPVKQSRKRNVNKTK